MAIGLTGEPEPPDMGRGSDEEELVSPITRASFGQLFKVEHLSHRQAHEWLSDDIVLHVI
jgi:hypothetical protein